ncbi:MAG: hypothetical protein ABIP46_07155 [Polaromonas sp.]
MSLFGATHIQFVGEGLLAIFADSNDTQSVTHGLRACRAALGLVDSAHRMRHYLRTEYPERQLPLFSVAVALHCGPVVLTRLDDPVTGKPNQFLPVGDAVSTAMLLQKQALAMGWPIIASQAVLASVQHDYQTGREAAIQLPGREAPLATGELRRIASTGEKD